MSGKIVGIVGSEQAKFTPETEKAARDWIRDILSGPEIAGVSSGHCHLGGVDIFAEEVGMELGLQLLIFPPERLSWEGGYKDRNLKIVDASDEVFCITLKELPRSYVGMRFKLCYHCESSDHVKSGGCWTVKMARKRGKPGYVIAI